MGDEGDKITVRFNKSGAAPGKTPSNSKKLKALIDDADSEAAAPPLPGMTFSVEDVKSANLADLDTPPNNKKPDLHQGDNKDSSTPTYEEPDSNAVSDFGEQPNSDDGDLGQNIDNKSKDNEDISVVDDISEASNSTDELPVVLDSDTDGEDKSERSVEPEVEPETDDTGDLADKLEDPESDESIGDDNRETDNKPVTDLKELLAEAEKGDDINGAENNIEPNIVKSEDSESATAPAKPKEDQQPDRVPAPITEAFKDAPKTQNATKPKKSHKKLIISIIVVLLLVAGMGTFGVYRYVIEPQHALGMYLSKFANSETRPKTFTYDIATQTKRADNSGRYSLNFSGSWDESSQAKTLLSLDINGKYHGSQEEEYIINAETVTEVRDNKPTTYINVHKPDFIGLIFPGSLNKWLNLDSRTLPAKFIDSGSCDPKAFSAVSKFAGAKMSGLVVEDAQRIGLTTQVVNGVKADQFRGKITGKELTKALKDILVKYNKACKAKLSLSDSDAAKLARITINYDVWLGQSLDKLAVVIDSPDNSEFSFSITTKDYGTRRNVAAPNASQSFESVIFDLDQDTFDEYLDESDLESNQESVFNN